MREFPSCFSLSHSLHGLFKLCLLLPYATEATKLLFCNPCVFRKYFANREDFVFFVSCFFIPTSTQPSSGITGPLEVDRSHWKEGVMNGSVVLYSVTPDNVGGGVAV